MMPLRCTSIDARSVRCCLGFLLGLVVLQPVSVEAGNPCQDLAPEQLEVLIEHATKGREAAKAEDYARAIEHYNEAQAVCPFDPTVAYSLARAYHLSNDCRQAIVSYERALQQIKSGLVDASVTADKVTERIEEVRSTCVDTAHVTITCADPGVSLQIDDREPMACPVELELAARSHDLTATLAGRREHRETISLSSGEQREVNIAALPPKALPTPPPGVAGSELWGWVTLGAGGALLITGAALHGAAAAKRSAFTSPDKDAQGTITSPTRAQALSLREESNALDTGGVITLSIGGAAVATGIILLLLDEGSNDTTLSPAVGEAQAGLVLRGHF